MPLDPTSLVPNCRYVAVYDSLGNPKILDRPVSPAKSIFVHDGVNGHWADGSGGRKISLPNLAQNSNPSADGVLFWNASTGSIFRKANDHETQITYLRSVNGKVQFVPLDFAGPSSTTGYGFAVRDGWADGDPVPAMRFIGGDDSEGRQILYLDNGEPASLTSGADGYVLTMENAAPVWRQPSSGSVALGGSSVGFSGVTASNTSASTVNVKAPAMTLTDGTDTVTVNAVNVSAALSAALGIGGLDIGSENANTWYYFYVVSDGVGAVAAVISTSASLPDQTNLGAYDYYALASVFRNDASSNIVDFLQRGRDISTGLQVIADPASVTTSYSGISSVNMTAVVPPIVKYVNGTIGGSDSAGETVSAITHVASTISGVGSRVVPFFQITTADMDGFTAQWGTFYNLPIADPVTPIIYWKAHRTSSKRRAAIIGYGI